MAVGGRLSSNFYAVVRRCGKHVNASRVPYKIHSCSLMGNGEMRIGGSTTKVSPLDAWEQGCDSVDLE